MSAGLPVVSLICAALLLLVLSLQCKLRNVPAATMTSWLLVANIAQAVNTVIWSGKVNVIAPVWCDIVTPVVLATSIAVLGAILCVCARLELLSSSRRLPHSTNSKRIETVVRIIFCILLPLFYAALHLVVQDHRFVIIEDFGCQAAIQSSAAGIAVTYVPILITCLAICICSGAVLINVYSKRANFAVHLGHRMPMSITHFNRLLGISVMLTVLVMAIVVFDITSRAAEPLSPWSWDATHLSAIEIHRLVDLSALQRTRVALDWWTVPVVSLMAFIMFGIGSEAMNGYKSCACSLLRRQGTERDQRTMQSTLPIHLSSRSFGSSTISIARSTTASAHTSKWSLDEDILPEMPSPPLRPTRSPVPQTPSYRPERPTITIPAVAAFPAAPRATHADRIISPISPQDQDADASFAESALSYVGSPTARQALGRAPSASSSFAPTIPPGIYSPVRGTTTSPNDIPTFNVTPYSPPSSPFNEPAPPIGLSSSFLQVRKGSEGEISLVAGSITDSILAPSNWPQPPKTTPSPPAVPMSPLKKVPKRSRSGTVGLGVVPSVGYTARWAGADPASRRF